MRILFDTNVLVSAFMAGSSCYDVIEHSIDEHEIYYTAFVIDEFKRVFRNDFGYPEAVINELVRFITKFFIKGKTASTVENVCRDSNDNQVLADTVVNDIEIIITGDKDLLDLKTYKGIKIITPREYWEL